MEEKLAEKGFVLDRENPDFMILTGNVETYREEYQSVYGPVDFPKAMVRITFQKPGGVQPYFEAAAYAFLDPDASQNEKNSIVDDSVELLLENFPPG